jgi:hypothetical protein
VDCKIERALNKFKIEIFTVPESLFSTYKNHPSGDFREGFWQLTLTRLFVLSDIHKALSSPILHIESDVLLMKNFPWAKFDIQEKLAWLKVSEDHDIAAILFSPNKKITLKLVEALKFELEKSPFLTDMTALSIVAPKLKESFSYLPSCPSEWSRRERSELEPLRNEFGGYFDPAALGIWNLGQDPRNHFGVSKMHVDPATHEIMPAKINLTLNAKGELGDQHGNKIFSLHVHAKRVSLFTLENSNKLRQALINSSRQKPKSKFYPSKFIKSFSDYPFPKNLWVLLTCFKLTKNISNFPIIKKLKSHYINSLR